MGGYVVGCDGGGTQTTVEVMDLTGKHIGRASFGPLNLNGTSELRVRQTIQDIFRFLGEMGQGIWSCQTMVIGAAGVSNTDTKEKLKQLIRSWGYGGPLYIVGDHETALYGAIGASEGAVVIAGTGAICFGKNKVGETARVGGWGHLIDDEGSGYAIARDILTAVVQAYDGRGEQTLLSELVYQKLGITQHAQLIQWVYQQETSKKEIAALASLLSETLIKEDQVSSHIASKACDALVLLVATMVETLHIEEATLALLGSVLICNEAIAHEVRMRIGRIYPKLTCQWAEEDAAYGAARMALAKYVPQE